MDGPLPRMRIGVILHPTVFFALSDGAGVLQHGDRPCAQRPDRQRCSRALGFVLTALAISPAARRQPPAGIYQTKLQPAIMSPSSWRLAVPATGWRPLP